jgi:hypothetical protein
MTFLRKTRAGASGWRTISNQMRAMLHEVLHSTGIFGPGH